MTHPDFQNIVEWDGPVLGDTGQVAGPDTGVLNVGSFQALNIYLKTQAGASTWRLLIAWSLDQAQAIGVGTRNVGVDAVNVGDPFFAVIRSQAPFVRVRAIRIGGAAETARLVVAGANRTIPYEAPPLGPFVLQQYLVAFGAGLTATNYPGQCFSGAALWSLNAGAAAHSILTIMNAVTGVYEWGSRLALAQSGQTTATICLPLSAWRMETTNDSAAAESVNCTVIPSPGGST